MTTSVIVNSNNLKIAQYWKEFNNSGQCPTLAICYQALRCNIEDQVKHFKKTMYCLSENKRRDLQRSVVLIFWYTEIEFISNNIKSICENTAFSLSHLELLKWMKKQDYDNYIKFKTHLHKMLPRILERIVTSKSYETSTENFELLKECIIRLVCSYLNENLIL